MDMENKIDKKIVLKAEMDVVGLVLGILSTVLSSYAFGIALGIVGIILSIKSRLKAKKDGKSTNIAIIGIVLNSIGIAFAIVPLLLSLLLVFAYMPSVR